MWELIQQNPYPPQKRMQLNILTVGLHQGIHMRTEDELNVQAKNPKSHTIQLEILAVKIVKTSFL